MQPLQKEEAKNTPSVKVILVIEDDIALGQLLILTIQLETPYQALLASNGDEALQLVQGVKPDLILLDYTLPGMNGLEFYERIKAIPGREGVPVILLTASIPKED